MSKVITIPNIDNYILEINNGTMILTPKKIYITEDDLENTNLYGSEILKCNVTNDKQELISNKKKYKSIFVDICSNMPAQKILQNTTFNFKVEDEKGEKGYTFYKQLGMSFQGKDAPGTFREIINFVKLNKYNIEIKIKLKDEQIINFELNNNQ